MSVRVDLQRYASPEAREKYVLAGGEVPRPTPPSAGVVARLVVTEKDVTRAYDLDQGAYGALNRRVVGPLRAELRDERRRLHAAVGMYAVAAGISPAEALSQIKRKAES